MAEIKLTLTESDLEALAAKIVAQLPAPSQADLESRPTKLLWNEREAAECLGVSPLSLKKWRLAGYIDAETETRPILYTREQLEVAALWLASRRQ